MEVIPNEECVTQHKLLVCEARIVKSEDKCKKFVPKICVWKVSKLTIFGRARNKVYCLRQRRLIGRQRNVYRENKLGGGFKRTVRIYLRREGFGSCGRYVAAKLNTWMQKGVRGHTGKTYTVKRNTERGKLICVKDNKENISCRQTSAYRK